MPGWGHISYLNVSVGPASGHRYAGLSKAPTAVPPAWPHPEARLGMDLLPRPTPWPTGIPAGLALCRPLMRPRASSRLQLGQRLGNVGESLLLPAGRARKDSSEVHGPRESGGPGPGNPAGPPPQCRKSPRAGGLGGSRHRRAARRPEQPRAPQRPSWALAHPESHSPGHPDPGRGPVSPWVKMML